MVPAALTLWALARLAGAFCAWGLTGAGCGGVGRSNSFGSVHIVCTAYFWKAFTEAKIGTNI